MKRIKNKLFPVELAIIVGMLTATIACFSGVVAESEDVSGQVLRLHILANSDSEEDQALKLMVRDAVLSEFDFDGVQSLSEAEEMVEKSIPSIEQTAKDVLLSQGHDDPVHAELVKDIYFDTRRYDDFTMPAGAYDALRITIGEAAGHNWWCVLYPPLCLPAAEPKQELADTLDESEQELVEQSPQYDVRFAVVELWESIKNRFS